MRSTLVETHFWNGTEHKCYRTKTETSHHAWLRETYPASTRVMTVDPSFSTPFGPWTEIVREIVTPNYKSHGDQVRAMKRAAKQAS